MSGGGFDINAFNPFDHWGDKKPWEKLLIGLPVGSNPASPKWIKQHPNEAMAAAAIAATALTMGAASPALAGGAAGAAGAGAAEAGAGAAAGMGSGLLGADYAALGMGGSGMLGMEAGASMFGPAAGGLASSLSAPAAATPFFTGAPEAVGAGASAFGPSASGASMLGSLEGPGAGFTISPWDKFVNFVRPGGPLNQGLKGMQSAQKLQAMAQGPQQQPQPMQRPQQAPGNGQELAQLAALFSNPVGQEQLKRLLRQQGIA